MASYEHRVIDIYGIDIYLARDKRQWGALKRKFKGLPSVDTSGVTAELVTTDGIFQLAFYIDVAGHDEQYHLINTCAHEAAHGALYIFDHINQETQNSHEPFAYLTGWLTQWIWEHCQLQGGK